MGSHLQCYHSTWLQIFTGTDVLYKSRRTPVCFQSCKSFKGTIPHTTQPMGICVSPQMFLLPRNDQLPKGFCGQPLCVCPEQDPATTATRSPAPTPYPELPLVPSLTGFITPSSSEGNSCFITWLQLSLWLLR